MPDGLFGLPQRLPPSNIQAEQALLGAMIANNKAHERVCDFLRPEHFADPIHGRIYAEMDRMIRAGRLSDAVTLKAVFENSGTLDEVGGTAYLAQLMTAMVGIINAGEYGGVVRDCWVHRQLIELGEAAVNAAFSGEAPADLLATIGQQIDRLAAGHTIQRAVTLDAAMDAALAAMERAQSGQTAGISTGFRCFDDRLGGLEPGLVYVVGGRPGMGKSSVGHQIAVRVARAGHGVLELSLEMSATQIGMRTLATAAGVPLSALKAGRIGNRDADAIVRARKELAGLPLTVDDTAGQTPAQIAAKARAARRKHGLGLVMIDHLNLMKPEAQDAKHGGTWAVERASGTMLEMAKQCECPVLLLAQLNRGVESREDKRPTLADLRQAGAIEQDAYAVGFVYRAEYYLGHEPEPKEGESPQKHSERLTLWHKQRDKARGRAEMIWAKVRDGEPGTDNLAFDGPTATFGEDAGRGQ